MRVIGIDASTTCSGVAVIDDGDLIYHGIIDMKKNKDSDQRIMNMISELGAIIKEYAPAAVYIEDSWNKKNIETTKMLSNVLGAVMYVCQDCKCAFTKLLPSVWRSLTGIKMVGKNGTRLKRDELKQAAVNKVKRTYKINCGDDEAEAICIAEAGWLSQNSESLFE
jgi:Holliday junction resolvasome RuvABC endonuclease subunit